MKISGLLSTVLLLLLAGAPVTFAGSSNEPDCNTSLCNTDSDCNDGVCIITRYSRNIGCCRLDGATLNACEKCSASVSKDDNCDSVCDGPGGRRLQWNPRCFSSSLLQDQDAAHNTNTKTAPKEEGTTLENINDEQQPIYCSSQDGGITKEDIPSHCFDKMYNVDLSAVFGGPHFFLIGTKVKAANSENEYGYCPPSIAMDQFHWQKKMGMIVEEDFKDLHKHHLGSASLGDILKAEESVDAIDASEYDYLTNGCAHYAQRIWRSLGFEETEALANFFVDNIVDDSYSMERAEKSKGGIRALASIALGGKGGFKDYVGDVVYSQLDFSF